MLNLERTGTEFQGKYRQEFWAPKLKKFLPECTPGRKVIFSPYLLVLLFVYADG